MERPTELHLGVVKTICRYVKGNLDYGLIYAKGHGNYILSGFRIVTWQEARMIGKAPVRWPFTLMKI